MHRVPFDPSCGLDIATTTIRDLEGIATIHAWGYRAVRHDDEHDGVLYIHEAYYDEGDGLLGIAARPATPCGETWGELEENLRLIAQALLESPLRYADLAPEGEG